MRSKLICVFALLIGIALGGYIAYRVMKNRPRELELRVDSVTEKVELITHENDVVQWVDENHAHLKNIIHYDAASPCDPGDFSVGPNGTLPTLTDGRCRVVVSEGSFRYHCIDDPKHPCPDPDHPVGGSKAWSPLIENTSEPCAFGTAVFVEIDANGNVTPPDSVVPGSCILWHETSAYITSITNVLTDGMSPCTEGNVTFGMTAAYHSTPCHLLSAQPPNPPYKVNFTINLNSKSVPGSFTVSASNSSVDKKPSAR
jgi:hypothetical protein